MSDVEQTTSDLPPAHEPLVLPPRRRSPLGRLGCGCALAVWFLLILTPCALGILATQGEITVNLGSAPGQQLRVWLIMEPDERGIGVSSPARVTTSGDTGMCMQTDVRYLLWEGEAESVSYCECYERASADASWVFVPSEPDACTRTPG